MLNWRKLHRRVHFYLGLSVGLIFVIIGLSGAVLVFYNELDSSFNLPAIETASSVADYDTAFVTLGKAYPEKTRSWRFEVNPSSPFISARYYQPEETADEDFAPMMVWLTKDGKQVLRRDFWGQYFATWMYNLHFRLLAGPIGGIVVGYLGIGCTYILISGLWAWWPKPKHWKKQLSVRHTHNVAVKLYDWHKLIGLCFAIPLLLLCITGVMLALPEETRRIAAPLLGPADSPKVTPLASQKQNFIPPSEALQIALTQFDSAVGAWIETPDTNSAKNYYRIRVQVPGDPSRRFPHTYIYIDGSTGQVLETFDYYEQGKLNTMMNWLHPLHDGTLFGIVGRIFWTLCGVTVFVLFVLGVFRWRYRVTRKERSTPA
nr:PepSY domain-containing protein [Aestuariibacter sp. A3R04]